MKRIFDVAVSSAALLLLSPVMLAVAGAIRLLDGRPVIYAGQRLGAGGATFRMLKFRTMRVGAPDVRNADGSTYAGSDDPRTTAVGRWLRKTSLDELPQLWNVLRGDMSLVGPRPDLPDQVRYYTPADYDRLKVRPGLTGLAQVSGRNNLTWEERRALDREYVATLSFINDLRILVRTVPGVLFATGVFVRQTGQTHDGPHHR